MNACENHIVVYQPNEIVRLVYGRMLIDIGRRRRSTFQRRSAGA